MTLLIGAYIVTFAVSTAALDRYKDGFIIDRCPVCGEGNLTVEERIYRIVGIPRLRRTVRCDNCRSVLREVGTRRWRYAVDATANPEMYAQHNNAVLTEQQLKSLVEPDGPDSPSYIE